jgi:hypothetical protein
MPARCSAFTTLGRALGEGAGITGTSSWFGQPETDLMGGHVVEGNTDCDEDAGWPVPVMPEPFLRAASDSIGTPACPFGSVPTMAVSGHPGVAIK